MSTSFGAVQSIGRNAPSIFLVVWLLVPVSAASAHAPDSLSFQGFVTNPGGVPIDTPGVSMAFKLYEGSSEIWSETQPSVKIIGGVFDVRLGAVIPLDTVRFDRPLSLGIKVGADPEISPRTPMAAAAYARALPGMYTFFREDFLNRSHNVIGGAANNIVGEGVVGATIGGGGGFSTSPIPISFAPTPNSVLHDFATVGGGQSNTASGSRATVGGGERNSASGGSATIGGGESNTASGILATVPGGAGNSAKGRESFAAGGRAKANHDGTFVWNDRSILVGND